MDQGQRQIETSNDGKSLVTATAVTQTFTVKTVGTKLNDSDGIEQEILVCNLYSHQAGATGLTDIPVRAGAKDTHEVGDKIVAISVDGGVGLVWATSGKPVEWVEVGRAAAPDDAPAIDTHGLKYQVWMTLDDAGNKGWDYPRWT